MKKIKLLLIGCILMLTFALGGCIRMDSSFVVDENNSVTMNIKYAVNKEKATAVLEEIASQLGESISPEEAFAGLSEETIDGKQYYVDTESQTYTQEELQTSGIPVLINKDKFYLYAASGMEDGLGDLSEAEQEMELLGLSLQDIEYVGYSVTLPSPVVKTNGVIQEDDQTTVVWEYTDFSTQETQEYELYAYTSADGDPAADKLTVLAQLQAWKDSLNTPSPAPNNTPTPSPNVPEIKDTTASKDKDTKAPVIKGVKKNKTYKKKVTVYVKDNKKLKKVTVNGKKAKLTKVKKGKYKGYFKFTVKKKGKNTIIAYDAAGNKKKINIKIK